jgi:hypothetical protein
MKTQVNPASQVRLEMLRRKINNPAYLNGAIWRIASVLCDEILDIPRRESYDERWKMGRRS